MYSPNGKNVPPNMCGSDDDKESLPSVPHMNFCTQKSKLTSPKLDIQIQEAGDTQISPSCVHLYHYSALWIPVSSYIRQVFILIILVHASLYTEVSATSSQNFLFLIFLCVWAFCLHVCILTGAPGTGITEGYE